MRTWLAERRWFWDCAAAAEMLDQRAASAMDPGFDGAKGYLHGFGDFGVAQLLVVEQQKGVRVFGPQIRGRGVNFLGQLVGGAAVGCIVGDKLDHRLGNRTTTTGSQGSATAVARDRQEPRQKVPLRVPAMQVF